MALSSIDLQIAELQRAR